jgi:hypothetical protein
LSRRWNVQIENIASFLTAAHQQQLDSGGVDTDTVVEQAWREKIDEWDLINIYGPKTWKTSVYGISHIAQLSQGIRKAFESPGRLVLPAVLPASCEERGDRQARLLVGDIFPRARSIWAMWGDRIYVFVETNGAVRDSQRVTVAIYSLAFEKTRRPRSRQFCLSPCGVLSDNTVQDLFGEEKDIRVCTTDFAASRLFGWTGAPGTPTVIREGRRAEGAASVFDAVRDYIDQIDINRGSLPFILR